MVFVNIKNTLFTFVLISCSAIAEPVITQRTIATAEVIVTENVTSGIKIYRLVQSNIRHTNKYSDVREVTYSVYGGQKVALALDQKNEKKHLHCIHANGKYNHVYYCLDTLLGQSEHLFGKYYFESPKNKKIYLRPISNQLHPDNYVLTMDVLSYVK